MKNGIGVRVGLALVTVWPCDCYKRIVQIDGQIAFK